MSTFLALDGPMLQRMEEALEKSGVSPRSLVPLRGFLVTIGSEIYRGTSVFFKVRELSRLLHRCEKTVRTWLTALDRAGILSKRRAGPKGIEVQLQPDFVRLKTRAKQALDPRREQAIHQRLLEMGDRVRCPEAFRRSLRRALSEEEVNEILARQDLDPSPEEPEAEPDRILEAAQWRVKEKKSAPGFTGFHSGEPAYLEATRRQLAGRPDQVRAILERKDAAEHKAQAEAEKQRRLAELAAETAARALREQEQERALLKTFAERSEEERRSLIEQAEAGLPRNIRRLRADHPTRLEQLDRRLLKLLKPAGPLKKLRDLGAELAQRLSRRRADT